MWRKELNLLFNKWLKELKHFFWRKELNPHFSSIIRRKELNLFFFQHDSMILFDTTRGIELFFFLNTTQRIELFNFERKRLHFSWIWRKELNPFFSEYDAKNRTIFSDMTQRSEPLFSDMIQRNWTSFFWYDSKNWTSFLLVCHSKNWTFFFLIWLKEMKLFKDDWKNWTLLIT